MPRASEFLELFQANAPALPERLSAHYRFLSVLGHGPESGAFLLRRIEDGKLFVLKRDTGGQDLAEEFRILERLRKSPVPEPVDYFEEDGAQYLIRTYLPGRSLVEAKLSEDCEDSAGFRMEKVGGDVYKVTMVGSVDVEPHQLLTDITWQNVKFMGGNTCTEQAEFNVWECASVLVWGQTAQILMNFFS